MKQLIVGHTLEEYYGKYGDDYRDGNLWDYSIEDFASDPDKPDPDVDYWLIKDGDGDWRVFEAPR